MILKNVKTFFYLCSFFLLVNCGNQKNVTNNKKEKAVTFLPYSDQENTGNWVLNTDASDEFDAKIIDEEKWYIVGKFKDGKPFYKHPDLPNKKVCAFVNPTNKIANKSEKYFFFIIMYILRLIIFDKINHIIHFIFNRFYP